MTEIQQKAERYANEKIPNAKRNDAPYFTSSDRWYDNYEAYLAGAEDAQQRITELEAIVNDFAAWSDRYPRQKIHSATIQPKMDGELIALEERAKQAALNPKP